MAEVEYDDGSPVEGGPEDQASFWLAVTTILLNKLGGQIVLTVDDLNSVDNHGIAWSSDPTLQSILLTTKKFKD